MPVIEIMETALYADDLAATERFYREVLGFALYQQQEGRHLFFQIGSRMLLIFDPAASNDQQSKVPSHGAVGAGHIAFAIAAEDYESWMSRLEKHNVSVELEYEWPSGGRSIYFRDPTGNSLEFVTPATWGMEEEQVFV